MEISNNYLRSKSEIFLWHLSLFKKVFNVHLTNDPIKDSTYKQWRHEFQLEEISRGL